MAIDHYYILITREQALTVPEIGTIVSQGPQIVIERFLVRRGIPGDTRTYIDGDRVYRIHSSHLHLFPLDPAERSFIPTREGDYFFEAVDPKIGTPPQREIWMPVGP